MPIHDYIISNGTGAAVRADINSALSAIVSLNSSASEPGTMYAYQLWADTALGLLKIRNSTNSAWVTLRQLDGDFSIVAVEDGLLATPSLTFTTDLNTGIFRPSTDSLGIVTGGQYAIACTSTQAVGIRTANPSAALHVAGVARIGANDTTDAVLEIGAGATGNRESYIDLVGDTTYFDYGARFGRSAGANGITYFAHRGTGAISIQTTEAGPITFTTTGTERLRLSGSGDFVFKGAGTTPGTDKAVFFSTAAPINSMVLDSSGRLLIGTPTARSNINHRGSTGITPNVQFETATASYSGGLSIINNSASGYAATLTLGTSKGAGIGSNTIVGDNEQTGTISFSASDGTKFIDCAQVRAEVDGTPAGPSPGPVSMPGRLVFSTTPSGSASPTERMRIKADGDVSIVTGNLIIGTAGKGIDFSADGQAAGMTSELLDDYEEGTWTPNLGGTATYSQQSGQYTKIGRLVNIRCNIEVILIGTGSTSQISGLPFTASATGNPTANAVVGNFQSLAVSPVEISAFVGASTTTINMTGITAAAASTSTAFAVFGNLARIDLTATYFV